MLGLWHPLKQLMLLVWKRYASFLFAPLLHALVPGSRYHEKPKLVKLHAVFTYLRLAFPSIRDGLRVLVSDERVNLAGRSLAQNLIDLFEFYIVLVSSQVFCGSPHVLSTAYHTYSGPHNYRRVRRCSSILFVQTK